MSRGFCYRIEEVDFATIPLWLRGSVKRYVIFREGEELSYCSSLGEAQRMLSVLRLGDTLRQEAESSGTRGGMRFDVEFEFEFE